MITSLFIVVVILTFTFGIWLFYELRQWNKDNKEQELLFTKKPLLHSSGKSFSSYFEFTQWVNKNDLLLSEEIKKIKIIKDGDQGKSKKT